MTLNTTVDSNNDCQLNPNSQRIEQLQKLVEVYCGVDSIGKIDLIPLAGDASSRRYFSISAYPHLLAVDSPPENHTTEFIRIAHLLKQQQLSVPTVFCADPKNGYMVIENIQPSRLFYSELADNPDSAKTLLEDAIGLMLSSWQISTQPAWLNTYNATAIDNELQLFPQWFIQKLLNLPINQHLQLQLDTLFKRLIENFQQQPQVFVHRDFHCRNLLKGTDCERLTTIDFQDALWGPACYDLVSLLRDCYVAYPEPLVASLLEAVYQQSDRINSNTSLQQWQQWFDLTTVQRLLKVLGIFARLSIRDNKPQYLGYIAHILEVLIKVSAQYEELATLHDYLVEQILPLVKSSTWCKHDDSQPYPLLDLR